jgi:hypothetical protein
MPLDGNLRILVRVFQGVCSVSIEPARLVHLGLMEANILI